MDTLMKKDGENRIPCVSIITPAFNASRFLKETVESVFSQTFGNWEMIIVDDCSTDDTYEKAMRYSENDSRIIVLRNEIRSGAAATRNRALDYARGKYIAFLDADDLWDVRKLEKQLQFMRDGDFAFSYTAYRAWDGKRLATAKLIHPPQKMTAEKIFGDTSIACLTVMVNREKTGAFHMPNVNHTEDNITWQDILSRGFTAYLLDEDLALYRRGCQSLTRNKLRAAKQQWMTYRKYYRFPFMRSALYFVSYAWKAMRKYYF